MGGFFFDFEAVRTDRTVSAASMAYELSWTMTELDAIRRQRQYVEGLEETPVADRSRTSALIVFSGRPLFAK